MVQAQVVFLPIGDGSCGDAIALRFGELDSGDPNRIYTVLIDSGYRDDWQKVSDLMQNNFKTGYLDLVISTHPDQDHIGGLVGVLKNIPTRKLWMHLPWEHSADYLAARQEDFTKAEMTKWLQKSLQDSSDLAVAADTANVAIEEPFTGKRFVTPYGTLTVLGPSRAYYEELLPQILDKSAARVARLQVRASTTISSYDHLVQVLSKGVQAVRNAIESHYIETLTDNGKTTPSNNSSTVILFETADGTKKWLFTGDAGIPALENAHAIYTAFGHKTGDIDFIQVPHHGSKQNVGASILDKFLGVRTSHPDIKRGTAYLSVGEECKKDGHPKKIATNAFKRRGYLVYPTKGTSIKHGHKLDGFSGTAHPLPLYEEVEADE